MNPRVLVLLAGGAAIVWSVRHWRQAIQLAMVLLVLEGAIRKWLFPGAQDLVYFAKDVVFLAAYAGFLREKSRRRFRPPPIPALYASLVLGAVIGLFQIFNPNLPNVLVGILGFKSYFLYVPLLVVLPAAFPTDEDLWRFLRRYVLFALPIGALATLQFFSPADSPLNTYARGELGTVVSFGSSTFVRVTGTFSYITGYSAYLLATAILIIAVLTTVRWRVRGQSLIYAALVMTIIGMFMTGSRGPVFLLALLFPIYGMLAMTIDRRGGILAIRIAVGTAVLLLVVSQLAPQAMGAFLGRASSSSDAGNRALAPLLSPFQVIGDAGAFGFGIGATHQGATALAQDVNPYAWLRGAMIEVESGRVMLELGPVGFLLVYFSRLFLPGFALLQVFRLRSRFHRALATSCLLFLLAQLPGSIVFDPTTGVYYWFFAGLLAVAMRLDAEAKNAAIRAAAAAGTTGPSPATVRQPGTVHAFSPEARRSAG